MCTRRFGLYYNIGNYIFTRFNFPQDLVPCIVVSFEKEQIVVWRGKNHYSSTSHNRDQDSFLLGCRSSGKDETDETV